MCSCVLYRQIYSCMLIRSEASGVIHIYLNMIFTWKSVRFPNKATSPLASIQVQETQYTTVKWDIVEEMYFLHSIQICLGIVFYLKSPHYFTFALSTICLWLQDVVVFQKLGIEYEQDTLFFFSLPFFKQLFALLIYYREP